MDQHPIVTITLNPAVDIAADVGHVVPDVKLRCAAPQFDPGGGGINVSRAIAKLGGQSQAVVAIGGATGDMLTTMLADEGIAAVPIALEGQTRQSFTARDTSAGQLYRFVLPGPPWSDGAQAQLDAVLETHLSPQSLMVISGSLPPGADATLVERLVVRTAETGARAIIDTSGPVLTALAARSGPPVDLLRMDKDEALMTGGKMETADAFAAFGAQLIERGVASYVVIGLGAEGSLGVWEGGRVLCSRPVDKPVSAVGAGDSFVGAMVLALARGASFPDAVAFGTAAAASACTTPGTALLDAASTAQFATEVQSRTL